MSDASGTAFNKGITTVWYIVTDQNNNADSCSFTVTVLTNVVPPDNAAVTPDEVCPGDGNITLSYSGGVMPEGGAAVWYDDAGLTNNIGNGNDLIIPAPLVTSTYYVRFEGSCDTTSAVSTTVTVKELTSDPDAAYVDRPAVCPGEGAISLSYSGGYPGTNGSAVWYDDASFTTAIGSGNDLSVPAPLEYTIFYMRFEADCDTSAAVSVEVDVWPVPEPVFLEMSENVCVNGPLYRYVAGGLPGSTFTWSVSNGTIIQQINDTIYVDWGGERLTGSIELTETSINGCVSIPVSLDVEVGGPELDLGDDAGICFGESVTVEPDGDYAAYHWHDGTTASNYTTDQEGWITLEVADAFGCTAKDSIYLTVHDLPVVDLGPDTTVCGDEGIELDAGTDGISYEWSTGDISQLITVYMGDQEVIRVAVENEFGCIGRDTIRVRPCSVEFYFRDIPTAITPSDGNGLNDFWIIDKLQSFSQAEVEIFDRWGNLVWRSEPGYSTPWDGRNMNGQEVPMDSYHFVIDLNTGAKDDHVTGIITVIR
jgi:gliding motility-associated-like protein